MYTTVFITYDASIIIRFSSFFLLKYDMQPQIYLAICTCVSKWSASRVGALFFGFARTMYRRCTYIHRIFGRDIRYTVVYGVYIRLWPTLFKFAACVHTHNYIHTQTHTHTITYILKHTHTHTQTHTHANTHTHTHTHTRTHTHKDADCWRVTAKAGCAHLSRSDLMLTLWLTRMSHYSRSDARRRKQVAQIYRVLTWC